jgi:hypothetical protein
MAIHFPLIGKARRPICLLATKLGALRRTLQSCRCWCGAREPLADIAKL